MPMPLWFGHINKRVFNPSELRKGVRPVLTHVGRSSGSVYRVPLAAYPVEGGHNLILVYGSRADWVRNVLAAGTAGLRIDGEDVDLGSPRSVTEDVARQLLPATTKKPPNFLRITEFLQMDTCR